MKTKAESRFSPPREEKIRIQRKTSETPTLGEFFPDI
jgi:hypothetical protein